VSSNSLSLYSKKPSLEFSLLSFSYSSKVSRRAVLKPFWLELLLSKIFSLHSSEEVMPSSLVICSAGELADTPVSGVPLELMEHLLIFLIGDMLLLSLIENSAFSEAGFLLKRVSSI
jgi:hypothetical protein